MQSLFAMWEINKAKQHSIVKIHTHGWRPLKLNGNNEMVSLHMHAAQITGDSSPQQPLLRLCLFIGTFISKLSVGPMSKSICGKVLLSSLNNFGFYLFLVIFCSSV